MVNQVDVHVSDSSDEYVFTLNNKHTSVHTPHANITVCGTSFSMVLDTGATVNILDKNSLNS